MRRLLGFALIVFGLTGCGSAAHPAAGRPAGRPAATGSAVVTVAGYAFHPGSLTVRAGARVTFVNRDATPHTATARGGQPEFDSGSIGPGRRVTVRLLRPGRYAYYCQFHAFMGGTLVVVR